MPPSPCTGSTNTAAVSPGTIADSALARSPYVAKRWPSYRGSNGVRYASFHVRLRLPSVRPWKQLLKDTVPVAQDVASGFIALARTICVLRANLIAASFASVPLLQ